MKLNGGIKMTENKSIKPGTSSPNLPQAGNEKRNGVGENPPATTSMPKWPIRPKR